MTTIVYGASDDLVEFEGDVRGEVSCYGTDKEGARGVLAVLSDGTILEVKYGKAQMGVWGITCIQEGSLFDRIEECYDENAPRYSDQAFFMDGIKWAYAAKDWERVK